LTRIYDGNTPVDLQPLFTREQIAAAVTRLAGQISADYAGKEVVLVVVLQGAFIFAADLAREISIPVVFDFIRLSSYDGMETTGEPFLLVDTSIPLQDRHVLIVEDIVDTGISLSYLLQALQARNPASLRTCALIDKMERRRVDIQVEYRGLLCTRGFLIGYGLDLNGSWRQLPAIYHAEYQGGRRTE